MVNNMAEIIGEHMMPVFEWLHIFPKNTYCGAIGYWPHFEVWELNDDELDKLIKTFDFDIGDEDWSAIASEDTWWRYSKGSNQGAPNEEFIINGKPILAWRSEAKVDGLKEMWNDSSVFEKAEYNNDFENYCDVWLPERYNDILEYFCEELGASTERNVCALVTDLAKYNNTSIADIFKNYC